MTDTLENVANRWQKRVDAQRTAVVREFSESVYAVFADIAGSMVAGEHVQTQTPLTIAQKVSERFSGQDVSVEAVARVSAELMSLHDEFRLKSVGEEHRNVVASRGVCNPRSLGHG